MEQLQPDKKIGKDILLKKFEMKENDLLQQAFDMMISIMDMYHYMLLLIHQALEYDTFLVLEMCIEIIQRQILEVRNKLN